MIQSIVGAIIQLLLFSLIPFCAWLLTARRTCNFFEWVGLKSATIEKSDKFWGWIIIYMILFLISAIVIGGQLKDVEVLATNQFSILNITTVIKMIIFAGVNTALSEEILFRGFFGKRLILRFGFNMGNSLQALAFGLVHGALLFMYLDVFTTIGIIFFTGVIGYIMGYIDEKLSGGSIVPSIILHFMANLISALVALI